MSTIELIYDSDCPNVPPARENLSRALKQAGLAPQWQEWDRADTKAPAYVRAYGSPTILVQGQDVAGSKGSDAASCRIYVNGEGRNQGVPPVEMIVTAFNGLCATSAAKPKRFGAGIVPLLPAIGTAVIPKLTCPACWPAYAGLLSAMGLGFINYSPYLLPLTAVFFAIVLVSLAWRAKTRRGYAPLLLGVMAAALVLVGKFYFDSDNASYVGVALLVAASLWNTWPRPKTQAACPACT